jgi:hypothetical protein
MTKIKIDREVLQRVLLELEDFQSFDLTRPLTEREKAVLAPPHPGDFGIPKAYWDAAKSYAKYVIENHKCATTKTVRTVSAKELLHAAIEQHDKQEAALQAMVDFSQKHGLYEDFHPKELK